MSLHPHSLAPCSRSRRPCSLRVCLIVLIVAGIALLPSGLSAQEQSAHAEPEGPSPTTQLRELRPRIDRLEGQLESMERALENQSLVAELALSSVTNMITYGSVFFVFLGAIAAFIGYRDLRRQVQDYTQRQLDAVVNDLLQQTLEAKYQHFEKDWDKRLSELLRRTEKLVPRTPST